MKFLLISGSPRKGNTDFILNKIFESIDGEKKLIFLKDKNVKHCAGCLSCDKTNQCVITDDMTEIRQKMLESDVFIIGTPNYFDNVPGLMKDFIDRTNPFYGTDMLKGKKIINIVVGGGEIKNSEKVINQALRCFAACHKLEVVDSYCFEGLNIGEIENNPEALKLIDEIIDLINKFQCNV